MESGIAGNPLSDSGEGGITNDSLSSITYTELFETHLPFFLSIGMSYEQYWDGDVQIAKYYRRAYEQKRERINEQLWLQGLYIYDALLRVAPAFRPMSKAEPEKYMHEPLPITETALKQRKVKEAKAKQESIREKAEAFASNFNKTLKNKKRKEENNAGADD